MGNVAMCFRTSKARLRLVALIKIITLKTKKYTFVSVEAPCYETHCLSILSDNVNITKYKY